MLKAGVAQINPTVGDLEGNASLIAAAYRELVAQGAELVVFPELAVCGYPPRDLLFKSRFVADTEAQLRALAREIGEVPAVIGFVEGRDPTQRGRRFYNAAAWCETGAVRQVARKCLLPTYDVFDEDRYFEAAQDPGIVEWRGKRLGITICEDIWTGPIVDTSKHYANDPLASLRGRSVDLVVNLSASPWHLGKDASRQELIAWAAKRAGAALIYCNAVGGNDELIFDGHSMAATAEKGVYCGLAGFRPQQAVIEVPWKGEATPPSSFDPTFRQERMADLHDALVLGIRDYGRKTAFSGGLIGLSGGIDSALTAALAADAFGPENVMGVSLPSRISSEHSRSDAQKLAENLGVQFHLLPIGKLVEAAEGTLAELFAGTTADVTEENIQARSRGLLLMALSNKFGALLLSTGNKSEMAVGYCTLYGDMAGGLAVLSDVPKTMVYELARWYNREREVIPWNTIEKPPSAELRPDQKDEDSLPPYEILDAILRLYVEEGRSRAEIVERGYDEATVRDVVRKVDLNEYKRKQAAPGLKVTTLAFGVGRRIPIVQRYVS